MNSRVANILLDIIIEDKIEKADRDYIDYNYSSLRVEEAKEVYLRVVNIIEWVEEGYSIEEWFIERGYVVRVVLSRNLPLSIDSKDYIDYPKNFKIANALLEMLMEGYIEDRLEYNKEMLLKYYNLNSIEEANLLYNNLRELSRVEGNYIEWLESKGYEAIAIPS